MGQIPRSTEHISSYDMTLLWTIQTANGNASVD